MSKSLLVVGDRLPVEPKWDLPSEFSVSFQSLRDGIPDRDALKRHNLVVVMGRLGTEAGAIEFGGALRLAVEDGLTAVLMYPVKIEAADRRLVEQLFPGSSDVQNYSREWTVTTTHSAFHDYFAVYGRSGCTTRGPATGGEVLGQIDGDACAVAVTQGSGMMYVVPFHVADISLSYNTVVKGVLGAIDSHLGRDGTELLPEHLTEIRLPGEAEILTQIEEREAEVTGLREKADRLQRYRQIIGRATGDILEEMIIEVLNVILEGTDVRAEDREDVGAEDFWLVGPDGDLALAEAKGVGGHVRRPNVNQVDDHRDAHDLQPEETPGLLIVNVFRNATGGDASQRELPVSPGVVAHAVRNNVLVLRTRDLFYLLHRKMAGQDAGQELLVALQGGGGWLQVGEDAAELKTS